MKLRGNRTTEREAVNAVRSFFESQGCVFQEVDTGNDYGKDAYVDITEGEKVTGLCIGLQIKGGKSFQRAGGYVIPLDSHAEYWKTSSIPIAGIVYDPNDKSLHWCNISEYLLLHSVPLPTLIPIPSEQLLTPATLYEKFKASFQKLTKEVITHPILNVLSSSEQKQIDALLDCFAFGRNDARVLIALRYLLNGLENQSLLIAIRILSHVTPHPDIFWHSGNWIPDKEKNKIKNHFQWNQSEIEKLLSTVDFGEWDRGGYGEDLFMLLLEDPQIKSKIENVAIFALDSGNRNAALTAFVLTIYWAGENGYEKFQKLVLSYPNFKSLDLINELEEELAEYGYVSIF